MNHPNDSTSTSKLIHPAFSSCITHTQPHRIVHSHNGIQTMISSRSHPPKSATNEGDSEKVRERLDRNNTDNTDHATLAESIALPFVGWPTEQTLLVWKARSTRKRGPVWILSSAMSSSDRWFSHHTNDRTMLRHSMFSTEFEGRHATGTAAIATHPIRRHPHITPTTRTLLHTPPPIHRTCRRRTPSLLPRLLHNNHQLSYPHPPS